MSKQVKKQNKTQEWLQIVIEYVAHLDGNMLSQER